MELNDDDIYMVFVISSFNIIKSSFLPLPGVRNIIIFTYPVILIYYYNMLVVLVHNYDLKL